MIEEELKSSLPQSWQNSMKINEKNQLVWWGFQSSKQIFFGCMHFQSFSRLNSLSDEAIPGILSNDTGWCLRDKTHSPFNYLCMTGVFRFSHRGIFESIQLLIDQWQCKWGLRELCGLPVNQVWVLWCIKVDLGDEIWADLRWSNSLLLHVVQL